MATTPAFRASFAKRRCIVPADGFYEWERMTPQIRQPNLIRRVDGEPMAFAGLWSIWRDPAEPDAEPLRTFTIVTTTANATLAPIHDRMPVILPASAWDDLAGPGGGRAGRAARPPAPGARRPARAVPGPKRVNNVRNEGPELVIPLGPTGPAPGSVVPG